MSYGRLGSSPSLHSPRSDEIERRARMEGETDLAHFSHLQCFESDLLFWREIILIDRCYF